MFVHNKRLQYHARPERPDPLFAKKMQEILGGQFGEITVMMQYLFQGWNCRGAMKYRDMLLDIGTEEIGHVEMITTMIARLLEGASVEAQEEAVKSNSLIGAALGGTSPRDMIMSGAMNPQHMLVSGLGTLPADSVGYPWTARYMVASGNLLADFRANLNAESQGRLQVCRLYELTTDQGVHDMLSFLIARDTMHQNQWLAAIQELESSGLEQTPCPSAFPQEREMAGVAYDFISLSQDGESSAGRWASGPSMDGKGEFRYVEGFDPIGEAPTLRPVDPQLYGTPRDPLVPQTAGV